MELEELITHSEGKTLEFKRDASSPGPILRTLCAFANTAGGTLLIGIEDRSGNVVGVEHPLDQEERIASIISDGISPRLVPDIDLVAWRDTHVIAVRVYPGPSRPYAVRASGQERSYVRIGSTNRLADDALRAELARGASGASFDESVLPSLTSNAIDTAAVADALNIHGQIREHDLRTLRLAAEDRGRLVPTVGGLLLFGRDRLDTFPDAWIQAGRFKGTDRRSIIDSADIIEYPMVAIERVIAFINRNTTLAYEIHGDRRMEIPEYPPAAIREAVVNAVAHTDYSQRGAPIRVAIYDDRIEITNPGMLVAGLTVADLKSGISRLRNRVIGRVLREAGLVEQWGSGVQRMIAACETASLPEPCFEELGTSFRVTLFSAEGDAPRLDPLDDQTLAVLREAEGLSTSEVAERIARSTRSTRTRLQRLVEAGLVVEIGSSPNDPQRRYFIAEEPGRYGATRR